jgi:hypothetical protein
MLALDDVRASVSGGTNVDPLVRPSRKDLVPDAILDTEQVRHEKLEVMVCQRLESPHTTSSASLDGGHGILPVDGR